MNAPDLLRELLADQPYERADAPYQLLRVHGPDAGDFLHRLCSQDVLALADGRLRPAAFLDPKGKLLVTCLVFRLDGAFWLETQAEQVDRLTAVLERYHFTEKLAIERPATGSCFEDVSWWSNAPADCQAKLVDGRPVLSFGRRGVRFTRAYGGALELPHANDDGSATPVAMRPLDAERAECVRMLVGLLRVGVETEPTTLALEADLDDHLSTTKGCYTGQEIVARIHTYGHTNRKACLLWLGPGAPITAAQALHELEDKLAVGRVLHAVPVPGRDERLGVGYLPKDFHALGTKLALADGGAVEVIGYEPLPSLPA
jgi:folate-binding protein YgfZ